MELVDVFEAAFIDGFHPVCQVHLTAELGRLVAAGQVAELADELPGFIFRDEPGSLNGVNQDFQLADGQVLFVPLVKRVIGFRRRLVMVRL